MGGLAPCPSLCVEPGVPPSQSPGLGPLGCYSSHVSPRPLSIAAEEAPRVLKEGADPLPHPIHSAVPRESMFTCWPVSTLDCWWY